jgi:hypothetical protein
MFIWSDIFFVFVLGEMDQEQFQQLLANEKENFKTLYEKVPYDSSCGH